MSDLTCFFSYRMMQLVSDLRDAKDSIGGRWRMIFFLLPKTFVNEKHTVICFMNFRGM